VDDLQKEWSVHERKKEGYRNVVQDQEVLMGSKGLETVSCKKQKIPTITCFGTSQL